MFKHFQTLVRLVLIGSLCSEPAALMAQERTHTPYSNDSAVAAIRSEAMLPPLLAVLNPFDVATAASVDRAASARRPLPSGRSRFSILWKTRLALVGLLLVAGAAWNPALGQRSKADTIAVADTADIPAILKLEDPIEAAAARAFLEKVQMAAENWATTLNPKDVRGQRNFEVFRRYAASHIRLQMRPDASNAVLVQYQLKSDGSIDRWLVLNMGILDSRLDKATEDKAERQALITLFTLTGQRLRDDDGRWLIQFIEEESKRLQEEKDHDGYQELMSILQAAQGEGLAIGMQKSPESLRKAGVMAYFYPTDSSTTDQRFFYHFTPYLTERFYSRIRELIEAVPGERMTRNTLTLVLRKEGRGKLFAESRPGYILYISKMAAMLNENPNQSPEFLAEFAARFVVAEAVGLRSAVNYAGRVFNHGELDPYMPASPFANKVQRFAFRDDPRSAALFSELFGRLGLLVKDLRLSNEQRELRMRREIFDTEFKDMFPALVTRLEGTSYTKGPNAYRFLMDGAFTNEFVVADPELSVSPGPSLLRVAPAPHSPRVSAAEAVKTLSPAPVVPPTKSMWLFGIVLSNNLLLSLRNLIRKRWTALTSYGSISIPARLRVLTSA